MLAVAAMAFRKKVKIKCQNLADIRIIMIKYLPWESQDKSFGLSQNVRNKTH
jgi:hypothetical protein